MRKWKSITMASSPWFWDANKKSFNKLAAASLFQTFVLFFMHNHSKTLLIPASLFCKAQRGPENA